MKYIFIILFALSFYFSYGQGPVPDSLVFKSNLDKYINRDFEFMETDSGLMKIELKYGTKLNSLASCYVLASINVSNNEEILCLNQRIKQIAEMFCKEGTPILISVGGFDSIDEANRKNMKGNKYNVTFISLGNHCIIDKSEIEFQNVFNERTMQLLGIKDINF